MLLYYIMNIEKNLLDFILNLDIPNLKKDP